MQSKYASHVDREKVRRGKRGTQRERGYSRKRDKKGGGILDTEVYIP